MAENDVEVSLCALSRMDAAAMLSLLSADERERAGRFHFERDRRRFVAARGMLRTLLADSLASDPGSLQLVLGPHGKPRLADDSVRFNVSHSDDLALYAISRTVDCGVDVEAHRPTADLDTLVQHFFSRAEVDALTALDTRDRTETFFRCWVRKEAVIKATGLGLALALNSFDVPIEAGALPCTIFAQGEQWWLHDVPVPRGFSGALAVGSANARLVFHDLSSGA